MHLPIFRWYLVLPRHQLVHSIEPKKQKIDVNQEEGGFMR